MTDEEAKQLGALRERIDTLDDEIVRLVAARAAVVDEIAALKRAAGVALHDPGRESAIVARLVAARPARLSEPAVTALTTAVLRACSPAERG